MNGSQVIDVAAGLIFRRGKLLITQRRAMDHLGGFWEFPGGKREADESYEHCLRRELREELGIEVEVGELFEDVIHAYPEKTVHLKFFCCQCPAQEPRPIACQAVAWVTREQLEEYEFPAADFRLLWKLRAETGLWDPENG